MPEETTKPKPSVAASVFAAIAITTGMMASCQALLRGHSAGWEMMMIYSIPAVITAAIAIAIRRQKLTYVALVFGGLGLAALFLGS